jgi:hypothetical protein
MGHTSCKDDLLVHALYMLINPLWWYWVVQSRTGSFRRTLVSQLSLLSVELPYRPPSLYRLEPVSNSILCNPADLYNSAERVAD